MENNFRAENLGAVSRALSTNVPLPISRSIGSTLTAKQQKLFLLPLALRLLRLLAVSGGRLVRLHPLLVTVIAVALRIC